MIYFWLGCVVFFVFITFATYTNRYKNLTYLTGGHRVLELMGDKPDEHTVSNFIADIHDAMRAYYRNKYALVDLSLPKEYSVNQFKWLREIKAINEAEYQQLIESLETQYLL